jgi:hypothetical protein
VTARAALLTPTLLVVTTTIEGEIYGARQSFPPLVSDGRDGFSVEVSGRRASVRSPAGSGLVFEAPGLGPPLTRVAGSQATRAGMGDGAFAETSGRTLRWVVKPLDPGPRSDAPVRGRQREEA